MTARLTLTDAGAAAIASDAHVGIEAVTFTRLALGSGTGAGDQSSRAALDAQHDVEAVTGSTMTNRIAIRADYTPAQDYSVTEAGLFAQVGAGAEFLAAYWIAESATDALAAAASGTTLVLAGVVEIQDAGADINIAPALNISIGAPAGVVYQAQHATVDQRGIAELATLLEGRGGLDDERIITALVLAGVLERYIPANTRMVFYQAAAPVGWTLVASVNDRLLRVVSGAGGGTGGQWEISGLTVGGAALTVDQVPSHTHGAGTLGTGQAGGHSHTISRAIGSSTSGLSVQVNSQESGTVSTSDAGAHGHVITGSTDPVGGGATHTHDLAANGGWRPAYADVIVCSKD